MSGGPAADLILGNCLAVMRGMEAGSIDAVICDPPYPEIDREYGRWTEAEWHELMRGVVGQCRRILKPTGSAVFVLQPNSERAGKLRPWLFEFQGWACRTWNMVQDAWWWNTNAMPVGYSNTAGLLRSSLKACVWLGPPDCYRDQDSVLMEEAASSRSVRLRGRFCDKNSPSRVRSATGSPHDDDERKRSACVARGGTTPFNVLPFGPDGKDGKIKHCARTPLALADWWVRYISPPGGVVLDPFAGSGTVGIAAHRRGRSFVGIERYAPYVEIARARLAAESARTPLLSRAAP